MDPKSVLLGLREKSVGLSKAQTRIPWREIITALNLYDRESQKTEQIDTDVWAYYAESADGRERGAVRQTEIR